MPPAPRRRPRRTDAALRDVALYRAADADGSAAPDAALFNFYNLLVSSLGYGLAVNGARTGLGTDLPVGHSLRTESLYYQALRVFSYFDWELGRSLLYEPRSWPLPAELALIAARLPVDFVRRRREQRLQPLLRLRRAARIIAPRLRPFDLRQLLASDVAVGASGSAADPRALRVDGGLGEALRRGALARLASVTRDAGNAGVEVGVKLEAMIDAFTPLATLFWAAFDRAEPLESFTRLAIYLPAYHSLHAEELDRPESWFLEKGLPRVALPKPVALRGAEITHLSYLQQAELDQPQAIKIEFSRDFDAPDRVTSVISFGRLVDGASDEPLALDTSDHRDALHVHYHARLPQQQGASDRARTVAEALNRTLGAFEVDARIHHLTLQLRRPLQVTLAQQGETDELLRPSFDLDASRISFRAHRQTDGALELAALRAAGFECTPDGQQPGLHQCHRDFRTWDQLGSEVPDAHADQAAGGEALLSRLVGIATREVLARSIPSIEDALDEELAQLLGTYLERYGRARRVLTDRLHRAIF